MRSELFAYCRVILDEDIRRKEYWFKAPAELIPWAGLSILVDTVSGTNLNGIITKVVVGTEDDAYAITGFLFENLKPIKMIIVTEDRMRYLDLSCLKDQFHTIPRSEVFMRKYELYRTKKIIDPIIVAPSYKTINGHASYKIIDGYASYLIARMMRLKTVKCIEKKV